MAPKKSPPPQLKLWLDFLKEFRRLNPQFTPTESAHKAKEPFKQFKKDHGF